MDFYYYIINFAMIFSYYLVSLLMNISFIGRRFSLILCLLIVIILKITKIVYPLIDSYSDLSNFFVIIYLILRLALYTSQIPTHILINESFSTKERLHNYSTIYTVAKIASLISPFALEYLSEGVYDYLIIFCCSAIVLIILFLIEETLNKKLRD